MDKEIRFIDSGYRDLFRIPDGGKIKVTLYDGEQLIRKCKYIDDYHVNIEGHTFHICEYAELMERNGNTYEPAEETLKNMDLAYVEQNYDCTSADKFYKTPNGFTEVYYNPDANEGGQIVQIDFDEDIVKNAARLHKAPKDFFSYLEGMGRGYLTDAGTPEFRVAFDNFKNSKCDFEGCTKKTMQGLMKAVGIKPKSRDMER